MKLKNGMNVAQVEASQVVPLFKEPLEKEEICEQVTGNINGESQFENLAKEKNERMSKIL